MVCYFHQIRLANISEFNNRALEEAWRKAFPYMLVGGCQCITFWEDHLTVHIKNFKHADPVAQQAHFQEFI